MVLHAGIICNENETKFITFDSETHEKTPYNFSVVASNHCDSVDGIFKNIKSLINDQLGCLCICLGNSYDSKIRETFIDRGKGFGFDKVEITDSFSANFVALISASDAVFKNKLQNGDFVWVFSDKFCRIWRKDEDQIRFVMEFEYLDTVESLENIRNLADFNPDMILYENCHEISYRILEEMFRQNVRVFSFTNIENGVLIKARIMAGDKEVMCYNIESLLEQNIEIRIGDNILLSAKTGTPLPYYSETIVENEGDANVAQIVTEHKTIEKLLPNTDKFIVKQRIDKNGILSVEFDTNLKSENYLKQFVNPFVQKDSNKYSSNIKTAEILSQITLSNNTHLPQEMKNLSNENSQNHMNSGNCVSIFDDNNLDEITTSNNSPILAAIARLQPLPKY
uniref:Uncharacterized protein n=1 Tax=Panagrolaimus sp. PS1159 TaxID=55785 RepID=A0AC35F9E2_9BILA